MIRSKRFKAIVKTNRLFKFRGLTNVSGTLMTPCEWSPFGMLSYIAEVHPQRLKRYKRNLYLLSLCSKSIDLESEIGDRYGQLAFLATVNDIAKALVPYPELLISFTASYWVHGETEEAIKKCAPEIKRSPLMLDCHMHQDKWRTKAVSLYIKANNNLPSIIVTTIATPDFFKVISAPLEFRKFETIFNWVVCNLVRIRHDTWLNRYGILDVKHTMKVRLKDSYKDDPVKFKLLSQTAKLLLP